MPRQDRWNEPRGRDYDRYADESYRGRDEDGRPYGAPLYEPHAGYEPVEPIDEPDRLAPEEARSFAREADPYDAAPYGFGAGYGREGLRAHRRDWRVRTRDELASWMGDQDAQRRREWDRIQGGQHGRGPRGYRRSDERIREDVNDRLTDDRWLDASNIQVSVEDREVTLAGEVSRRADKRRAEEIVESVFGVTHVQNNLRVRPGAF